MVDLLCYKKAIFMSTASTAVGVAGTWTWFTHSIPAEEGGVCHELLVGLTTGGLALDWSNGYYHSSRSFSLSASTEESSYLNWFTLRLDRVWVTLFFAR